LNRLRVHYRVAPFVWVAERIAEAANLIHCRLAALPLITNDYRLQTVLCKRRYEGR
jgi:hypothetical protein